MIVHRRETRNNWVTEGKKVVGATHEHQCPTKHACGGDRLPWEQDTTVSGGGEQIIRVWYSWTGQTKKIMWALGHWFSVLPHTPTPCICLCSFCDLYIFQDP